MKDKEQIEQQVMKATKRREAVKSKEREHNLMKTSVKIDLMRKVLR